MYYIVITGSEYYVRLNPYSGEYILSKLYTIVPPPASGIHTLTTIYNSTLCPMNTYTHHFAKLHPLSPLKIYTFRFAQ